MQDMSATMSNSTYSPMLSRVHSETSFGNLLPVLNRYNRDHHETRRISQEGLICYDSKSVPVSPNTSQGRRDFKFCRSANASPIGSNSNIAMVHKHGSTNRSRGSSIFEFSTLDDVVFFSSPSLSPKSPYCSDPKEKNTSSADDQNRKSETAAVSPTSGGGKNKKNQNGESTATRMQPALEVNPPAFQPMNRYGNSTTAYGERSRLDKTAKVTREETRFPDVKLTSAPASLNVSPTSSGRASPNPVFLESTHEETRFLETNDCLTSPAISIPLSSRCTSYNHDLSLAERRSSLSPTANNTESLTAPASLCPSPSSSCSVSPSRSPRPTRDPIYSRRGSFQFDALTTVETRHGNHGNRDVTTSPSPSYPKGPNMASRRKQLLKSRSSTKLMSSLPTSPSGLKGGHKLMGSLLQMRNDLSNACKKLVAISNSMGDSVETLLQRQGSKSALFDNVGVSSPPKRRIKVIHSDVVNCSIEDMLKGKHGENEEEKEEKAEEQTRNISPGLTMTSLKNRLFTAQVSLTKIPEGEITLYVNNFQVLIISGRVVSNNDYD